MRLPEKGSFGYFDKKKKLTLTATIISFLIVAAIYATGILIYHTNKSIFTVIAALSVLPAAKVFVSFLVIASFHSLSKEQRNELCFLTEQNDNQILYDILLASEEKSLIVGTIVLLKGHILMYSDSKKADVQAAESYIKRILTDGSYASVKMYTDFEQMKKGVQQQIENYNRDRKNTKINDNKVNDDKVGQQIKNRNEYIKETILIYTI